MTDWLVELLRGRSSDRAKARDYIAQVSEAGAARQSKGRLLGSEDYRARRMAAGGVGKDAVSYHKPDGQTFF